MPNLIPADVQLGLRIPDGESTTRVLLLDDEPLIEALTWLDATAGKPDAEQRVLMWIASADDSFDWDTGWWDGEDWHLCESGGIVDGEVMFFAEPQGPRP